MWRTRPNVILASLWVVFAARLIRRRLRRDGVSAHAPRPPRIAPQTGRSVLATLAKINPTCLEHAYVVQAWLANRGHLHDIVIGIPPDGLHTGPAHAWVDGLDSPPLDRYLELHRVSPPPPPLRPTLTALECLSRTIAALSHRLVRSSQHPA